MMFLEHINAESALLLALTSSFCFANASFIYRKFATRISPLWMNCLKASGATFFFSCYLAVVYVLSPSSLTFPPFLLCGLLMLSGFIGLNVGDYFILTSYREIGPGRTMMITAFNPLFLSLAGYFFFDDLISKRIMIAIVCLSLVLITLGHENYRKQKRWSVQGYFHALAGAFMDASGILITRYCFSKAENLDPFLANWYRLIGALTGFIFIHLFIKRIHLIRHFKSITRREQGLALFSSFLGTFFALALWLIALKKGHMGLVSAMGGFGPLYATSVECLIHRKWPSAHVALAVCFFVVGFLLIVNPPFVGNALNF